MFKENTALKEWQWQLWRTKRASCGSRSGRAPIGCRSRRLNASASLALSLAAPASFIFGPDQGTCRLLLVSTKIFSTVAENSYQGDAIWTPSSRHT
jgi:hypothetical protein